MTSIVAAKSRDQSGAGPAPSKELLHFKLHCAEERVIAASLEAQNILASTSGDLASG